MGGVGEVHLAEGTFQSLLSQSAGKGKGDFVESKVWLDFVIANEQQVLKIS